MKKNRQRKRLAVFFSLCQFYCKFVGLKNLNFKKLENKITEQQFSIGKI